MSVTKDQINLALAKNGTNLTAWARDNHYNHMTVRNSITRWEGRNDRKPHGGIARQVMRDLTAYVNASLSADELSGSALGNPSAEPKVPHSLSGSALVNH